MRVAHVHRIRGIGGSERHLLTLLPALAELGVEPVLVGLDDPAWDPADFYGALTVPAIRIPSPRDVDPLLLARLLRPLRADVVHTHLVHADVYGGVAAKLRGESLVSTKHNDDPFRLGPFRHVERGLARRNRPHRDHHGVAAPVHRRRGGDFVREGRDDPLRARRARPSRGARIRRTTCRRTRACCSQSPG